MATRLWRRVTSLSRTLVWVRRNLMQDISQLQVRVRHRVPLQIVTRVENPRSKGFLGL
jgi:hypothetical protein